MPFAGQSELLSVLIGLRRKHDGQSQEAGCPLPAKVNCWRC